MFEMSEKILNRNYTLLCYREGKTEYGFNFNSFDRYGDDLCELILSYLSVKD